MEITKEIFNKPSADRWLAEAKSSLDSGGNGMYLFHNGVVRATSKAYARGLSSENPDLSGMEVSYDESLVESARQKALNMPGISCVKVWINSGMLKVGDDIMMVLVAGDIRPNVVNALENFVDELKKNCIIENEIIKVH